jgi:hypothetical protein
MASITDVELESLLFGEIAEPASPAANTARLFLDIDGILKWKNSAGTVFGLNAMTNPMTTKGDIILGDTGGTPSRLAAGTATHVLTANGAGAFPSWQALPAGGITQAYAGYNTAGGSWENMTARRVYMKKITIATACLLSDIEAYLDNGAASDNVDSLAAALFSDNAGTPRDLLAYAPAVGTGLLLDSASGAGGNTNARWFGRAIGYWVTAADYWIAVGAIESSVTGLRIAYDGSGSDRYYTAGGDWMTDAGFTTITTGSNKYSIRANTIR